MKASILLIEDDTAAGAALRNLLHTEGYEVELATRGDDGLALANQSSFDLVVTDFKLPGLSGLELIARLHEARPRLPIIMMTAHGSTETVIEATKLGACDYLTKPFEADEMLAMVAAAVQHSRLMTLPVEMGQAPTSGLGMVGSSRIMCSLYKEIGRVAATPVSVLIRGETGTGKELVARAIYQHSDRADKPLIAVNCAAIPQTLLESELFGYERGAFTGAQTRRIGRFEQAHGGTLFLDEIGDLTPDTQAKLLRVLQEKTLERLGGGEVVPVDVRILAATHHDLEAALRTKEFREDLYYRLSVATLRVPALAERKEDIPELVRYFLRRHASGLGVAQPLIQPEAVAVLADYHWPGNVRELENVVRQALLLARPFALGPDHVQQALDRSRRSIPNLGQAHAAYISSLLEMAEKGEVIDTYWRMISDLEPELFIQAIRRAKGNQTKAARWLGITRLKMREKLAQLGLHPAPEESDPEADAATSQGTAEG